MSDPAAVELSNYWKASRQLADERRKDEPDQDVIEDSLSEIEAIVLHTENPHLRTRCQTLLSSVASACRIVSAP